MKRRHFSKLAIWASLTSALSGGARAQAQSHAANTDVAAAKASSDEHHAHALERYSSLTGGEKLIVGLVVYPGMFLQDMVGPLAVFEALMNRDIHLLWKNTEPVGNDGTDSKALIPVTPTTAFKDCPPKLDVLLVPGGSPGTLKAMEDPEVMAFLKQHGATARYVTSVCTGSLIFGAAGLLKGYRATSHWLTRDVLKDLGAIPTKGRVVIDRNRVTGGGVTAGIDLALKIVALLRSPLYAKAVQLYLEYDPAPPFNAGSPEKAPKIARDFLVEMFVDYNKFAKSIAKRVSGLNI